MKKLALTVALCFVCSAVFAQGEANNPAGAETKPAAVKTDAKTVKPAPAKVDAGKPKEPAKISVKDSLYAVGYMLGERLKVFSLTPDEFASVKQGMEAAVFGKKARVSLEAADPEIQKLVMERHAKSVEAEKKKATAFIDKFLKDNKTAQKLPSGVIYMETLAGTGETPKSSDTIKVHYHGTLADGTVFDSSKDRGTPATFPLESVIPCWVEGLQKVKVGGKAKLVCPSASAYGDMGRPPKIQGGTVLLFDVELLEIVKEPAK
ncbi:MAG: FKBP-type peptidyl-prolyl cis-trans isomerase [Elusimicrobia bacterium]|nr:FKBP-type peptidyl-prolyl cis-trans isomerase [Elusimicrobiota bacterium]